MRHALLLGMLLSACVDSSSPDPHELVTCDPGTKINGSLVVTRCEAACKASLSDVPAAAQCHFREPSGFIQTCDPRRTVSFDGVDGCCWPAFAKVPEDSSLVFNECL